MTAAAARASRELNIGFFSRMLRQTPWVRMKMASSLDGITALPNGLSQWITGAPARADGHAWRARACASSRIRVSAAETALALATLPPARGTVQEALLFELLSGALDAFREMGVVLVGGHGGRPSG